MTLLDSAALRHALAAPDWDQRLVVTPLLDRCQVTEASIDLRLGNDFLVLRRSTHGGVELEGTVGGKSMTAEQIQAQVDTLYERMAIPFGEGFWLHPQQFALGATLEFIKLPLTLGASVLSRSTWGRLGLLVATAITVQPGFAGALTLELVNESDSPIKLYPGLKIAQLTVHGLPSAKFEEEAEGKPGDVAEPRKPTYKWPTGPQAALILKEYAELEKIKKVGAALAQV